MMLPYVAKIMAKFKTQLSSNMTMMLNLIVIAQKKQNEE